MRVTATLLVVLVCAAGLAALLQVRQQRDGGSVTTVSDPVKPTEAQCDRADAVLQMALRDQLPEQGWSPEFVEHARKMAAAYRATGGLSPPRGSPDPYEEAVVEYIHRFDDEFRRWLGHSKK